MITYHDTADDIDATHLTGGFFVGWPDPPSPHTHLRLLRGSQHVLVARDGDVVVGFVTAVSDGVLCAYLPLLEVLPAYQRRGIGRELVLRMFARLRDLYMVDLCCDTALKPFYERLGMQPATAMILRRYDRQAGS